MTERDPGGKSSERKSKLNTKPVGVYIDQQDVDRLKIISMIQETSVSDILRTLIKGYFAQPEIQASLSKIDEIINSSRALGIDLNKETKKQKP